MTAVWLFPVLPTIVAASTGSLVASVLPNSQHALWTIIISYVLWGIGLPLAMFILCIYFHRLAIHQLPAREVIVSVFIPLGPLGLGGFTAMNLGKAAMDVFPLTQTLRTHATDAGDVLYILGWMLAIVMWGFGLVWLFFAVATISKNRFPFNVGWWGFTFPLGVFTLSTGMMGRELPSRFFDILATVCYSIFPRILRLNALQILTACVVLLWLIVSISTIWKLIQGQLLFAPCLKVGDEKEKLVR